MKASTACTHSSPGARVRRAPPPLGADAPVSISAEVHAALVTVTGAEWARDDAASRLAYGTDALQRGAAADLVLIPGTVDEIAAIARICHEPSRSRWWCEERALATPAARFRCAAECSSRWSDSTGSSRSTNANQLAVAQPNVLTYQLQDAVEARGLFYPPDPASLKISALGGNVAECAGGPRAVKYGTTRRYVLALQAVFPTGEIIRTGSKAVKNVVGYDLTQLLVGSEGTLAILTEITVRLMPKPKTSATLQATFRDVDDRRGGRHGAPRGACRARDARAHRRRLARAVERYLGRPLASRRNGHDAPGRGRRRSRRRRRGAGARDEACFERGRLAGDSAAATGEEREASMGGSPGAFVRAPRRGAAQDQPRRLGPPRPRAAAVRR